jgi:two-component system response regulator AtoC
MASSDRPNILLVDDDPALRDSLSLVLKQEFAVSTLASGEEALELLRGSAGRSDCDVLLLDVMMPGLDGIELLKQVKSLHPELPVVMVSASNTIKTATDAMKLGAIDFLQKPFQIDELINTVQLAYREGVKDSAIAVQTLANTLPTYEGDYGELVGKHPLMEEIYTKVDQVAPRNTTVLITGESGTGKELIARELHRRSDRKNGPFIAINCAAIPESLVESEFFGHEKGAFTHAVDRRIGHFELAEGGTIFLDEVGELSPAIQVKLLRVLQEREFYRVGRSKSIKVDIRIISATNRSLETAVGEGTFRQDLFYRLNVVNLDLPPLRKRSEDLELLVKAFIKKLSAQYGKTNPEYSEKFISVLKEYAWPGNVRELENVIESILALSNNTFLTELDIPNRIRPKDLGPVTLEDKVLGGIMPFDEAERLFETEIITKALERTQYIQTKAAELLGISRRILKYKMDKLGILVPEGMSQDGLGGEE